MSSMTVICANEELPSTFTSNTIQCNRDEVCVDYFDTENSAQAQCAVSYTKWDNKYLLFPCSSGTSYGGEDIAVGATTYDVEPIQVDQFGIYLNDQEIAITTNLHNVSTIVRGYKNGDGNFSSCFKFRGTALITGYLAGFGAS
ncbi:hypothetical protein RhiirA5_381862 [Rhizophagus irregularis]|uniref:Uncharacterized protein n=2 Tax=Rhizophagus irregularis TaxID=588596 RepID=A0A2N0P381_9GLOM|nr:hypothetical protein RirG_160500 [Rhizophagus irregularis DAOM 197198w]PKC01267.1 hypothetical protein RhiirA5_381862 [Rhizophagus irregularis]GBC46636.1 glycosyltransferase family 1 protein [Rhizophagus irregularis DAOM 181602=DAOM 197198]UZO25443.1 hypothetical protein OCT59_017708 [Rhizophagus irregularis]CAB4484503.1 unnamed protein product [Rhizophagus irregularis]